MKLSKRGSSQAISFFDFGQHGVRFESVLSALRSHPAELSCAITGAIMTASALTDATNANRRHAHICVFAHNFLVQN